MKKKLAIIACIFGCTIALTACGAKTDDYNGYTREQLYEHSVNTAEKIESISDSEMDQMYAYYSSSKEEDAKLNLAVLNDWKVAKPEIGKFVEYKAFEVDKTGKTLTTTLTIAHEKRDIELVTVYNYAMETTAINVQIVYTKGEIMKKAALNTVMSMAIVFAVLIIISLIIYCFNIIPVITNALVNRGKKTEKKDATLVVKEVEKTIVENGDDDEELIAVIAAAIAASTGQSTDSFVVRSIKRRV